MSCKRNSHASTHIAKCMPKRKQEKETDQAAIESLWKFLLFFPYLTVGSDFDSASDTALHSEFTCACCGKTPACVPILSFSFCIFMNSLPRFPVSSFKPQLYRLTVHPKAQNIGGKNPGIPNPLLGESIIWIIRLFFNALYTTDHLKTCLLGVAF